jgi:hypothetical protein
MDEGGVEVGQQSGIWLIDAVSIMDEVLTYASS